MDSPYSPNHSVCPTDAIRRGVDGLAVIDTNSCIGCGLCVVRCPVGAIWVDEGTAVANVELPTAEAYEPRSAPEDAFTALRDSITGLLAPESLPYTSTVVLAPQIDRARQIIEGPSGQNVLRTLARNTFLLTGASARLKIVGDNNAACELLVDDGTDLLVVEIEAGADVLDAMRRVLAGTAIIVARYGLRLEDVTATLVINRMPNRRVDYYAVAADVQARLGLATITIPTAVLLLHIRAGGIGLATLMSDLSGLGNSGDVSALLSRFGAIDDPIEAGLVPAK
jgi:ferredoxin